MEGQRWFHLRLHPGRNGLRSAISRASGSHQSGYLVWASQGSGKINKKCAIFSVTHSARKDIRFELLPIRHDGHTLPSVHPPDQVTAQQLHRRRTAQQRIAKRFLTEREPLSSSRNGKAERWADLYTGRDAAAAVCWMHRLHIH